MFEYVKLYFISLGFSFIIAVLIIVFLKILKKDTVDIRNWLAKYINFKLAEWIVVFFPWILAFILFFPVKNYLYVPSKEEVKQMVLKLYQNSPVLKNKQVNLDKVVRDINVLYIIERDSNVFEAEVTYKFLNLECSGILRIVEPKLRKYVFEFKKNKCYPRF